MLLSELTHQILNEINLEDFSNSFVPYLYLDGHRSGSKGISDSDGYKNGYLFFVRFGRILKQLGFKQMVTMVHTQRNFSSKERIDTILTAIKNNFDDKDEFIKNSAFKIYGDTNSYKQNGHTDFYKFLSNINNGPSVNQNFTHHILINYSEEWGLKNLQKINCIPEISSVIRFTKGFVSGGWVPIKMQRTSFIYSQIPSISEFWSDESITALILISLNTWIATKEFIGTKSYCKNEKEVSHLKRDLELSKDTIKLNIQSPMHNRIIAFGINGPISYEF